VTRTVPTECTAVGFNSDGVVVVSTDPAHIGDAVREAFLEFYHVPARERGRRLVETGAGYVETVGDSEPDADRSVEPTDESVDLHGPVDALAATV